MSVNRFYPNYAFFTLALSGCAGVLSAPSDPPPEIVAPPVALRDTDPNRVAIPHADGPDGLRFADFFGDLAVAATDCDCCRP